MLPTDPAVFEARVARAAAAQAAVGADAALVTSPSNVRYLTGFTGSAGAALLLRDDIVLATDGRYAEQAAHESPGARIVLDRDGAARLLSWAADSGTTTVAIEAHHVSLHDFGTLTAAADGFGLSLVPVSDLLDGLRLIKDDHEVDRIRRACTVTMQSLEALWGQVAPGVSEQALAQEFIRLITAAGADGPAFEPIIATGANASRPHHRAGASVVKKGDVIVFDVGARVDGYCADLSRTVCVGTAPAQLAEIHREVQTAQSRARAALAHDVPAAAVDAAAREHLVSVGLGELFVHGTGHGVGLDIHEAPLIGPRSADTLQARSVVTVEPGAYLPGLGGVRIEDTMLVTPTGSECLTDLTRDLVVL